MNLNQRRYKFLFPVVKSYLKDIQNAYILKGFQNGNQNSIKVRSINI